MNDLVPTPDDPKLTAYALGELEGDDLAEMERALRVNPALRVAVEEIRAAAGQLEAALAAEPEAESIAAAAAASPMHETPIDEYRPRKPGPLGKLLQFPQIYYVVGGLAAACFALAAVLRTPPVSRPAAMAQRAPSADDASRIPLILMPPDKASGQQPLTVAVNVVREPAPVSADLAAPNATATGQPSVGGTEPARELNFIPGGVALQQAKPTGDDNTTTGPAMSVPPRTTGAPPAPAQKPDSSAEIAEFKKTLPASTAVQSDAAPDATLALAPSAPAVTAVDAVAPAMNQPPALAEAARGTTTGTPAPNAPAPGINAPALANATPPPAATKMGFANNPPPKPLNPDDVVQLSAFEVSAQRAGDAAALGAPAPRVATKGKPFPPRGARFSRTAVGRDAGRENDFLGAEENPKSWLPADVGNASYGLVRRAIENGRLPARDVVKIEELVNYFPYRYVPPPAREDTPFAAALEVTEAPWAPTHRLVRIGLKGRDPSAVDRLLVIAKDVRIEVTFNAAKVSSYRLIGYENARLDPEDYKTDGIEVSAGHSLTALYEIVPVGAEERRVADKPAADNLLYQGNVVVSSRLETASTSKALTNELLMVTVGYAKPEGFISFSKHTDFSLVDSGRRFADASADFKFAAAVAEYGMILRNSPHKGAGTLRDVVAWASAGAASNADDPRGYRGEFIGLVQKTQALLR
jgi:anti-sigma factor RsiW